MEHQKIFNVLNIVNDQSNANYSVGNEVIYSLDLIFVITMMLTF